MAKKLLSKTKLEEIRQCSAICDVHDVPFKTKRFTAEQAVSLLLQHIDAQNAIIKEKNNLALDAFLVLSASAIYTDELARKLAILKRIR
jgi:hypothetical protein